MSLHNNRIERTSGAALATNNALDAQMYNNTLAYDNLGAIPGGWQTGGNAVCGCDYTITQVGTYNNALRQVNAGKTVCLQAGHYDYLRFIGFVGTADPPIRFINGDGQVTAEVIAYPSPFVNSLPSNCRPEPSSDA